RLMAILDSNALRTRGRGLMGPACALAVLTVALASAQPAVRVVVPVQAADANLPAPATAVSNPLPITPAPVAGPIPSPQMPDSTCAWDRGGSFSGTMSTTDSGGRSTVTRAIGMRGGDRII